jgi:Na+-transporting NADH:ubiquinone oxidoreductase subunit NqrF
MPVDEIFSLNFILNIIIFTVSGLILIEFILFLKRKITNNKNDDRFTNEEFYSSEN